MTSELDSKRLRELETTHSPSVLSAASRVTTFPLLVNLFCACIFFLPKKAIRPRPEWLDWQIHVQTILFKRTCSTVTLHHQTHAIIGILSKYIRPSYREGGLEFSLPRETPPPKKSEFFFIIIINGNSEQFFLLLKIVHNSSIFFFEN